MLILLLSCRNELPLADPTAPRDEGPRAPLWTDGPGGGARFDDQGVHLDGGAVLVRTQAWGREGALRALAPSPARTTPCPATAPVACTQRIERDDPALSEWWLASTEALWQGWTVPTAPSGAGPLRLELALRGARAVVGAGEVWLEAERPLRVHGLAAWDADLRALPARFEPTDQGFAVVVWDQGARYPVQIDPIYEPAATTLVGAADDDRFGASLAGLGDIDGDGHDDVLIGAANADDGAGAAWLHAGTPRGLAATASWELRGTTAGAALGRVVAAAGDIDGDGFADALVGVPGDDGGRGRAEVYHGSASGLSADARAVLLGEEPDDAFGASVASAGDVNGDGYDDLLVGAPDHGAGRGRVYVHHGSASGVSATPDLVLEGESVTWTFGDGLAGVGDLDGDGYADVALTADDGGTGVLHVYLGSADGLSARPVHTFIDPDGGFGAALAGPGDLDGDGHDDLVLGQYGWEDDRGRVLVFYGSAVGLASEPDLRIEGDGSPARIGWRVAAAGDLDADGYAELLVASQDRGDRGEEVWVLYGAASGLEPSAGSVLGADRDDSQFGAAIAAAGDVDGDGHDDILVGDAATTGRVLLYRGYADEDGDGVASTVDCDDGDPDLGLPSTRYLDLDGDGFGGATALVCPGPGYVEVGGDCDDRRAEVNPGAEERCDDADLDEDCDGLADDADPSAVDKTTAYLDRDRDGHGGTEAIEVCDLPSGARPSSTDCDDADGSVNPDAPEEGCTDPVDRNCDGVLLYADEDGDGFAACEDCDDTEALANPAGTEIPGDEIDGDCDGKEICFVDADEDGWRLDDSWTVMSNRDTNCTGPDEALASDPVGDCDDGRSSVYPGATEIPGDGIDQDCDGEDTPGTDGGAGDGGGTDGGGTDGGGTDGGAGDGGGTDGETQKGGCVHASASGLSPFALLLLGLGVRRRPRRR